MLFVLDVLVFVSGLGKEETQYLSIFYHLSLDQSLWGQTLKWSLRGGGGGWGLF